MISEVVILMLIILKILKADHFRLKAFMTIIVSKTPHVEAMVQQKVKMIENLHVYIDYGIDFWKSV